jgi:aromatic ring-opening dioxygenase catalytic subunit (LigB family)
MLYDYGGFPAAAYRIEWPAPGHPELARQVAGRLLAAGFETASDGRRGFDHGTFVPLKLAFPEADIPTLQLSLIRGLDPLQHIEMGRALASLRDQGVLILCSGMSFHNMRAIGDPRVAPAAAEFDAWLQETVALPEHERTPALVGWTRAPSARTSHPREEHLIPLMVAAGAAGADAGVAVWTGTMLKWQFSAVHFGA